MIDPTPQGYQQLLKQFYRKAIRTHPNRSQLITKFIRTSLSITQQKSPQLNYPSSPKVKPSLNILQIKTSQRNKIGTSRQLQPQSAKLSKKYSDQKQSLSGDSDISRKKNKQQQKYFNCQWIYKSLNFKKTLSFAIIYVFFQINDLYSFTKLKDNIEIYFDQNPNVDQQMRNAINQWTKLDQTFQKKDRVRWTKILPQIFMNFPQHFINVIFKCLTRLDIQDSKKPNKQQVETLSKNLKLNINYFQIFYHDMQKLYQKTGNNKIQISIGWIRQQQNFVFANKLPQKSQQQKKKDKAIKNISQSIANLLKQYDANTERLMSLDILSQTSSKDNNVKNYLSKKQLK